MPAFKCPKCGDLLRLPDNPTGKISCPTCAAQITVKPRAGALPQVKAPPHSDWLDPSSSGSLVAAPSIERRRSRASVAIAAGVLVLAIGGGIAGYLIYKNQPLAHTPKNALPDPVAVHEPKVAPPQAKAQVEPTPTNEEKKVAPAADPAELARKEKRAKYRTASRAYCEAGLHFLNLIEKKSDPDAVVGQLDKVNRLFAAIEYPQEEERLRDQDRRVFKLTLDPLPSFLKLYLGVKKLESLGAQELADEEFRKMDRNSDINRRAFNRILDQIDAAENKKAK